MQKIFSERFLISTDKNLLDIDLVYDFLSTSYWSAGIDRSTVEKSIENSLCFAIYDNGRQVGFARIISDMATFAYLADVFIIKSYQGQGLGKLLIRFILDYPGLQTLRRILLGTRDAHSLYHKFGFKPLKNPGNFMDIHKPDIYTSPG
jgi:GNAT superfamily N-acetyltransferase